MLLFFYKAYSLHIFTSTGLLRQYAEESKPKQVNCKQEFWVVPCKSGPQGVEYKDAKTLKDCVDKCKLEPKCKGFDWLPNKVNLPDPDTFSEGYLL